MIQIRKILVPTDFSETADRALALAFSLARQHRSEVRLLHVMGTLEADTWGPLSLMPEERVLHENPRKVVTDRLAMLLAEHDTEGVSADYEARFGSAVAPAIRNYAQEFDFDLIVMGTHGARGVKHLLLGSVAEEVAHTATRPVLLVRPGEGTPEVARVLAPVDLSPHSRIAVAWAATLAAGFGAHLDLLHVVKETLPLAEYGLEYATPPEDRETIKERAEAQMAQLLEAAAVPNLATDVHLASGYPAEVIVDFAAEHDEDLVVMASHGRTGWKRFLLGSVAEKVMRAVNSLVLVVRVVPEE